MSWNKNTVVCSGVDVIVEVLRHIGIPYSLSVMKTVMGRGLNDAWQNSPIITTMNTIGYQGQKQYDLRRLEYNKTVILERMERTTDCDTDDVITSTQFDFADEPMYWLYEFIEENS